MRAMDYQVRTRVRARADSAAATPLRWNARCWISPSLSGGCCSTLCHSSASVVFCGAAAAAARRAIAARPRRGGTRDAFSVRGDGVRDGKCTTPMAAASGRTSEASVRASGRAASLRTDQTRRLFEPSSLRERQVKSHSVNGFTTHTNHGRPHLETVLYHET